MTKIPASLRNLPYVDRLKFWGLTSLEERSTRGDLIQMYKFQNDLEFINLSMSPQVAPLSPTRSARNNSHRIIREAFPARARNDFAHFTTIFFTNRVVGLSNGLSDLEVLVPSLNSFKARQDKLSKTAAIAQ